MPILNYTTTISAQKTVGEIMGILVGHGARSVLMNYDNDGNIESLSFQISTPQGDIEVRLPVNPAAVLRVLEQQRTPGRYLTKTHALKVAWRIVKTWVSAQMAILETEMVQIEEIFLPYIMDSSGKSLYQVMSEKNFLLGMGEKT